MAQFDRMPAPGMAARQNGNADRFNYYSAVQKILSHVSKNNFSKFASMGKSSPIPDAAKFDYVWNLDIVRRTMRLSAMHQRKSARESRHARETGNKYFSDQNYSEALKEYNKSVIYAHKPSDDYPDDHDISLALGNRSAVLYHLGHIDLALRDIELAKTYEYPKNLSYKLEDRRGKCYLKLYDKNKAKEAYLSAKNLLDVSNLSEEKQQIWHTMIDKQMEMCKGPDQQKEEEDEVKKITGNEEMPPVAERQSSEFDEASHLFTVNFKKEKGRFSQATDDVKVGSVLLAEKPASAVLSNNFYTTHCYHCFKRFVAPIGCLHCSTTCFCTIECRDAAWDEYHKFECKYLQLLNITQVGNIAKLALRIILVAGLDKLEQCQDAYGMCISAQHLLLDENDKFLGGVESLLALMTHDDKRDTSECFQYYLLAVFLMKVLEIGGFFKATLDSFKMFVGGVVARLLQVIACNGMEIMETIVPSNNIIKCEQESMGLAIYPVTSLINHSCHPNMEIIFYGNRSVARATRTVRKGEELTIDYGYVYYSSERFERQGALKVQYYFLCKCLACSEDWPVKADLPCDIPTFKCEQCDFPMPSTNLAANSQSNVQAKKTSCENCGFKQDSVMELLEKFKEVVMAIPLVLIALRTGVEPETLEKLESCITFMDEHLAFPWKDYVSCFSALRQSYRSKGNVNNVVSLSTNFKMPSSLS